MKTINDFLKACRANRYTYHNLTNDSIKSFKARYNYLKRHKDYALTNHSITQIEVKIMDNNSLVELDYLKKMDLMALIITKIK